MTLTLSIDPRLIWCGPKPSRIAPGGDAFQTAEPRLIRSRLTPRTRTVNEEATTEILLEDQALDRRVAELGLEISRDYRGRAPILVGILKGAVLFLADLARRINLPVEVDFISISSYGDGTSSTGTVRLIKDLDLDVSGRDVLVVEDIVDSGLSLAYIRKNLAARNPRSIAIAALLDKRERRTADVVVEYVGFRVPDAFVVGYGLDYQELFRGLPHVAVLDEKDLSTARNLKARLVRESDLDPATDPRAVPDATTNRAPEEVMDRAPDRGPNQVPDPGDRHGRVER